MICDTLDQLHLYKGFHKNLDTAIEFLAAHPLDTLPLGRTEVDGDEVFINVMDAESGLSRRFFQNIRQYSLVVFALAVIIFKRPGIRNPCHIYHILSAKNSSERHQEP